MNFKTHSKQKHQNETNVQQSKKESAGKGFSGNISVKDKSKSAADSRQIYFSPLALNAFPPMANKAATGKYSCVFF